MSFKIAYCAGHYLNTPGKRLPRYLDPEQTREWVLNDRVARYFAAAAAQYQGVELLRTDDPGGKTFIDIPERCAKANKWGADIYVDMHHNAGINGGAGGGVVGYCYPDSAKGRAYLEAVYAAVIAAGGLKGNRSAPLQEKGYDSLRLANAPAILMEYGFMDSRTDAPVILSEAYAKKVAYATMEGIAQAAGLQKKQAAETAFTLRLRQLQKGDTGKDVAALQRLLQVTADGIFGPKTESAVQQYQKAHSLSADGVVGEKTMASLLGSQEVT